MYARKLTKEELLRDGITEVTPEGKVFRGELEVIPKTTKQGYFLHFIYDRDDEGNIVKKPNSKSVYGYVYKTRSIGLHRLMWAWFNNEVPTGYVVDHKNNKHYTLEDYRLNNLQLLTPRENLKKERKASSAEFKCKLDRPRSY